MTIQTRLKTYGPPGSGKTKRAIDLAIESVKGGGKAVFTSFTRKARDEAVSRIPKDLKKSIKVATIHSLAFVDLGYRPEYVLNNLTKFATHVGEVIEAETELGLPKTRLSEILAFIGTWRNRQVEPTLSDFPKNVPVEVSEFIIREYREYKTGEAYVDYTDILTRYLEQGEPLKIDYMFVDEAQDLTALHWRAVEKMARDCSFLATFGDDDQSIFAWAGADPVNLMNWSSTDTKVLDYSYRLPSTIYKLSQDVISQVGERYIKKFRHNNKIGTVSLTNGIDFENDLNGYESVSVLFRNHAMSDWVKDELQKRGIKYSGSGSPFDKTDDVDAITSWEKWRDKQTITVRDLRNMARFMDLDLKGFDSGMSTDQVVGPCPSGLPWHEVMKFRHEFAYRQVYESKGIEGLRLKPQVVLSTVHHAKGGEWDKVILLTDMSKKTYDEYITSYGKDNEHRVWYVATTRARKHLQIVKPKRIRNYPTLSNYDLERVL